MGDLGGRGCARPEHFNFKVRVRYEPLSIVIINSSMNISKSQSFVFTAASICFRCQHLVSNEAKSHVFIVVALKLKNAKNLYQ